MIYITFSTPVKGHFTRNNGRFTPSDALLHA